MELDRAFGNILKSDEKFFPDCLMTRCWIMYNQRY